MYARLLDKNEISDEKKSVLLARSSNPALVKSNKGCNLLDGYIIDERLFCPYEA